MRKMKWVGVIAGILLIVSCFLTWVVIVSKNIVVTGIQAEGTNFGKPGYLHILLSIFFIALSFIPRIWAKRTNLFITALNLSWSFRNFFFITACMAGECPVKHIGIYMTLVTSVLMLIGALFPDIKIKEKS